MKEEWLMPGAVVPVDPEATKALVDEIKRLIGVVGGLVLKQGPDYERGFIDGMQKQAQSSVDRAVNASLDRIGDAMDEVAHRFAHRLALDLECVLAKYDGPWYDQAWETLSQYRSEMNKLHEQVSPTFMGEPLIKGTP
jgi:hypothetical protein